MALWNVDLSTEDGALGAAQIGSYACFVAVVLGLISTVLLVGVVMSNGRTAAAIFVAAFALIEIIVYAVAGFRLRAGKGIVWGIAAAVLLTIEVVTKIAAISLVGTMINGILLVGVINGIRGARAMGRIDLTPEEAAEIFS
ncbi:hypothetical protein BH10PSE14_BH10PSE14_01070 [soil metagenome]